MAAQLQAYVKERVAAYKYRGASGLSMNYRKARPERYCDATSGSALTRLRPANTTAGGPNGVLVVVITLQATRDPLGAQQVAVSAQYDAVTAAWWAPLSSRTS